MARGLHCIRHTERMGREARGRAKMPLRTTRIDAMTDAERAADAERSFQMRDLTQITEYAIRQMADLHMQRYGVASPTLAAEMARRGI